MVAVTVMDDTVPIDQKLEIVMAAIIVRDDAVPIDQKFLWQRSLSWMTLCQLIRNFYGSSHCHGG